MFRRFYAFMLFAIAMLTGLSASAATHVPYSIDFTKGNDGWTAIDLSDTPGVTWKYDPSGYFFWEYKPAVVSGDDWESNANDYWISPAFELEAGKSYKIATRTSNFDKGTATLTLALGTSAADAATFATVIATLNPSTAYLDYTELPVEQCRFTVAASGVYHIAYHIVDVANNEGLALFDFSLEECAEGGIDNIEADDTPAVYYNLQGIKVDRPSSGICLMRQGSRVTKVYLNN